MKPIFGPAGRHMLESLAFTRTLYAFDFDGTLARIVREPAAARMTRETSALLLRLSEVADVIVISGRSVADLGPRVPLPLTRLVGNHGMERLGGPSLARARVACARWSEALVRARLEPGVQIEDKSLSLSVHYRRARSRSKAKQGILDALEGLRPVPRVVSGKCVLNLLPKAAIHKGIALQRIIEQKRVTRAFYIGDDDTDEDVFALPDERVMKIRVGRRRDSQAAYFLDRQARISALLRLIIVNETEGRGRR